MNLRALLLIAWFAAPLALAQQAEEPPPEAEPEEEEEEKRIWIIGGGGGGGSGGAISFEWNGPGRLDYGIYDHGCMDYGDEFRRLVNANSGLIGSVTPQTIGWDAMQATLRTRFADVDPAVTDPATPLAVGDPEAALAQLFAAVQRTPDDTGLLFNFAATLSRNGLANEALTVIDRIRTLDRTPILPHGINPQAGLDYQAGYAEMLRGNLAAAKASFQSTIGREPFLNEAAHGLALIQAHEGNAAQGRETYRDGMWRFKPKYLVLCGGRGSEDVRPPVDDMYDTSMGVEGKLVDFWHPDKASDLEPFYAMVGALAMAQNALAEPLKLRMIEISNNPRFAGGTDDPYDAWAAKLSQLIWSLDEFEPFVLQQQEKLESAIRNAQRVAGTNQGFVLERVMQLAMQPGNHCPTYRSLISQGVQGVRPHAERVEAEFHAFARIWYKMATGLNSNIGDPEWFEYNDVSLRATLDSMSAGMIAMIMNYYAFPGDLVQECPEEFVEMFAPQEVPAEPGDSCKELFGNLKFKHSIAPPKGMPGPKHDIEVGCDKISVKSDYDLVNVQHGRLGLRLGGRFSGEFVKGKGFSMFGGVGADAKAFGQSGSVKAGGFVEGDYHGLTGLGAKVIPVRADGSSEPMSFNLLPKVDTARRGPLIRNFRAPP